MRVDVHKRKFPNFSKFANFLFFFFFFCSLQTVMPIVEAYLSPPDKFVPEPGITSAKPAKKIMLLVASNRISLEEGTIV